MKMIKIRVIALLTLLTFINILPVAFAKSKEPITLEGSSYKLMKNFMNKYNQAGFSKAISLGNQETYRAALVGAKIKIDPKLKSMAQYDPATNTISLSKDPRKIKPNEALSLGDTIWHEVTHRIEVIHKDDGILNSKAYNERNIEYMTYVANTALPVLEQMEKKAGTIPASKLAQYWKEFNNRINKAYLLEESKKYPPDLKLMKEWFGFKVNASDVKKLYAGGSALKNPKASKALVSLLAVKTTPAVKAVNWGGAWTSNWGDMTLTQNGSSVTGGYTHDTGRINGVVSGNKLTGTWSESPSYGAPNDAGGIIFTISADGKSFSGSWRYGSSGAWSGGWTASRKK